MIPLGTSAAATLDIGGAATRVLGPVPVGRTWVIRSMVASGSGAAPPTLRVYRDSPEVYNFVDGTSSANNDQGDYPQLPLGSGQNLVAVWSGGTPGAQVALWVTGDVT